MKHTFTTMLEFDVTVFAHVSPAVPPVPCSDPDHPAYSDPGDPGESYVEAVFLKNKKTGEDIDITDCLDEEVIQDLADQAYEEVETGE